MDNPLVGGWGTKIERKFDACYRPVFYLYSFFEFDITPLVTSHLHDRPILVGRLCKGIIREMQMSPLDAFRTPVCAAKRAMDETRTEGLACFPGLQNVL